MMMMMILVVVPQEQTACQKAVQEAGGVAAPPGRYIPQCDEDGEYKPLQVHPGTGESWCVERDGTEIPGTRTPADKPPPVCSTFTGNSQSRIRGTDVKPFNFFLILNEQSVCNVF